MGRLVDTYSALFNNPEFCDLVLEFPNLRDSTALPKRIFASKALLCKRSSFFNSSTPSALSPYANLSSRLMIEYKRGFAESGRAATTTGATTANTGSGLDIIEYASDSDADSEADDDPVA